MSNGALEDKIANAIESAFISHNDHYSNWEAENIVDVLAKLARSVGTLAIGQNDDGGIQGLDMV